MAIVFVQAANARSIEAPGANPISATLGVAVGAAGFVVGFMSWNHATGTFNSVTDDKGNSYTLIGSEIQDTTDGQSGRLFYGYNLSGGPTVISANFSASMDFSTIVVAEFSGVLSSSSPLDGSNNQGQWQTTTGTGTDGAKSGSGTQTPSEDNCLIIGGSTLTDTASSGSAEFTAGTNFTIGSGAQANPSGYTAAALEHWIQTTATAANAAFTTVTGGDHITLQAIFKSAAGGGGGGGGVSVAWLSA